MTFLYSRAHTPRALCPRGVHDCSAVRHLLIVVKRETKHKKNKRGSRMGWDGMGWGKSAGGRRAQRIGGIGARSALDQQRIISGYFLRQGVGVYL